MYKTTVRIDGMACGMCEAHICDAIRNTFTDAKKVSASRSKGVACFLTEDMPDEGKLKSVIEATGYEYISVLSEPYVKRGLFG